MFLGSHRAAKAFKSRSENQTLRLCEHIVAGTPARTAADLVGVNKNVAAMFHHRLRQIMVARIKDESLIQGEGEIDESYIAGRRRGKRGRGAGGKVPGVRHPQACGTAASIRRCGLAPREQPCRPSYTPR